MITIYNTLEEKEQFFALNKRIDTKQDADDLWGLLFKWKAKDENIFRGHEHSKYKLFNSAQRYYHSEKISKYNIDYNNLIEAGIELVKSWNNNTISKYLAQRGIGNNCFAYLSLMQHYGLPTPLLDFTKNPFVALYFSTSRINTTIIEPIDEYSSLYFVNRNYDLVKEAFQEFFRRVTHKNEKGIINYRDIDLIPYMLLDFKEEFQIINNANIVNQEGVFFFTSHSHVPIEQHYQLIVNVHKAKKTIPAESSNKFLGCFNIHTSIHEYLQKRLASEMSITKEFLFPNFNDLRNLC